MIYLYAITEPGLEIPTSSGLDDRPLDSETVGLVAALYSTHERLDLRAGTDALWRHDAVVEAAMEHGTVLPVRFGTTLADTAALVTALEPEAPGLRRQLDRVRGCVELAVRVGLPPSDRPAPQGGRHYLQSKLGDREEREAVVQRTLVPLAELAVSSHTRAETTGRSTLKASYLVREHEVERFTEEVRRLQGVHRDLALSCTGPWPPYSFVSEEAA